MCRIVRGNARLGGVGCRLASRRCWPSCHCICKGARMRRWLSRLPKHLCRPLPQRALCSSPLGEGCLLQACHAIDLRLVLFGSPKGHQQFALDEVLLRLFRVVRLVPPFPLDLVHLLAAHGPRAHDSLHVVLDLGDNHIIVVPIGRWKFQLLVELLRQLAVSSDADVAGPEASREKPALYRFSLLPPCGQLRLGKGSHRRILGTARLE
mmetsp:Transcript_16567/g.42927  ORF Transcript_16567/g.42927 Transcript_16567/m.42927 type:complete len:208 (+) Transcript_16567:1811-2434(+)